MLQLRTFGGATLLRDGIALEGPASQRRRIALLTLLASAGNRGVSRDAIISLLWPDSEHERARHALSQWLFLLRRDLEVNDLVLGANELRLNPDRITADVSDFDAAVGKRDHAGAARLYTGPFLDGFVLSDAGEFERWVDRERERRHREAVIALESVARDAEQHDRTAAVGVWQRLAFLDPLSGRVAEKTIRLLRDAGDHAAALAHARRHEEILRRDLDMPPSPEVRGLIEELRAAFGAGSAGGRARTTHSEPYVEFVRQRLGGTFAVERVANRGSLATVFDAIRLADNAPVALRVFPPDLVTRSDSERLVTLLVEASRIRHEHIAPLGEPARVDGLLYVVAPRSSGRTLRDRLDPDAPIAISEALRIGFGLASALCHAAAVGIPHLDVTPRRILVSDNAVRLSDLGVMHALHASQRHGPTDSGLAIGTPAYMSPEQLEGDLAVGAQSDVYSLACVLFHALAGRPPHASDNSRRLIATRLGSPPLSVRECRADVSPELDVLLSRMLARAPTDRPPMGAVAGEFSRLVHAAAT